MKRNLTMICIKTMIRSKWKTVLLTFTIVSAVVLLSMFGTWAGLLSMGWTLRMEDHSFATGGDEHLIGYRFEADGVLYECLPLPDGMDRLTLKAQIDLTAYDRVVRGDIDYLVFDDPFETGEAVYLFVPIYTLGQDKDALVLYVTEVAK